MEKRGKVMIEAKRKYFNVSLAINYSKSTKNLIARLN
jgi:hypothetical protein